MPIKNKADYPANWDEISHRIRFERAQGKCEDCGAKHGSWVWRSYEDPLNFLTLDVEKGIYYTKDGHPVRLSEMPDEFLPRTDRQYDTDHDVKVVLTCAHLDHNPANNDESNLRALCQKCHLRHDQPQHAASRKRTRLANREKTIAETGQLRLFDASN